MYIYVLYYVQSSSPGSSVSSSAQRMVHTPLELTWSHYLCTHYAGIFLSNSYIHSHFGVYTLYVLDTWSEIWVAPTLHGGSCSRQRPSPFPETRRPFLAGWQRPRPVGCSPCYTAVPSPVEVGGGGGRGGERGGGRREGKKTVTWLWG